MIDSHYCNHLRHVSRCVGRSHLGCITWNHQLHLHYSTLHDDLTCPINAAHTHSAVPVPESSWAPHTVVRFLLVRRLIRTPALQLARGFNGSAFINRKLTHSGLAVKLVTTLAFAFVTIGGRFVHTWCVISTRCRLQSSVVWTLTGEMLASSVNRRLNVDRRNAVDFSRVSFEHWLVKCCRVQSNVVWTLINEMLLSPVECRLNIDRRNAVESSQTSFERLSAKRCWRYRKNLTQLHCPASLHTLLSDIHLPNFTAQLCCIRSVV